MSDGDHILERLDHDIDVIVDGGPCGVQPTTVVDLSGREAVVVRLGRGSLEAIGLA